MNPHELHQLSTPKLVERFISTEVDQFQAELQGDIAKQNKCVRVATAIAKELKNRPGDQRSMLLELYKHPNVQVRLMAAKLTLAVAPSAGRQLLESIRESHEYPQAMDAGMCLWTLEQGIFNPT